MTTPAPAPNLAAFQPHPDSLTEPFWRGASNGELILSRCPRCRRWQHPPLECCRWCAAVLRPESAPTKGRVYSYTTTYHHSIPLYPTPFIVAVIEIGATGGPRIVARIVDAEPARVHVGSPVRIEVRPLPGGSSSVPVAVLDLDGPADAVTEVEQ